MKTIIAFGERTWVSAVEQLGPAGAILAAVMVLFILGVLLIAMLGMVSLRAMREADTPDLAARPASIPMSPARRLELRRRVDERIGIEAANVVDLRGQQR
jgi:hypothetical protein